MSIFSHNIYQNIRTRTLVLHEGCILVHPPRDGEAWSLPGGGLEPHETLAECARREVLEETGVPVRVGHIAFVLEWVVPAQSPALEPGSGHGFGLEVYHFAEPEKPETEPVAEFAGLRAARWVPLAEVEHMPIYPPQLKLLCRHLAKGRRVDGIVTVPGHLGSPWAMPEHDPWA